MTETPGRPHLVPSPADQLVSYTSANQLTPRAPSGSPTDLMTLHASSLSYFQQTAEVAKVRKVEACVTDDQILEVRDGAEGLTTDAVNEKLLQN